MATLSEHVFCKEGSGVHSCDIVWWPDPQPPLCVVLDLRSWQYTASAPLESFSSLKSSFLTQQCYWRAGVWYLKPSCSHWKIGVNARGTTTLASALGVASDCRLKPPCTVSFVPPFFSLKKKKILFVCCCCCRLVVMASDSFWFLFVYQPFPLPQPLSPSRWTPGSPGSWKRNHNPIAWHLL